MKTDLWVENHLPVPLVALDRLDLKPGVILYMGPRYYMTHTRPNLLHKSNAPGWVYCLKNGWFASVHDPADTWCDDSLDYRFTKGRLLQPEESIHLRITL